MGADTRLEISILKCTDEGGQVRKRKRTAQPHASASRSTGASADLLAVVAGLSVYEKTYREEGPKRIGGTATLKSGSLPWTYNGTVFCKHLSVGKKQALERVHGGVHAAGDAAVAVTTFLAWSRMCPPPWPT